MIFGSDMVRLIQQGKKTETRRAVKYGERGKTTDCRYQKGRSYAIQRERGGRTIDRLTVTDVRLERLIDLTLPDARREGFRTRREFFDYWLKLHGVIREDEQVWAITFVKGDHTDQPRLLRGSVPMVPICNSCGRGLPERDYMTGAPITVCSCGARQPQATEQDHGYTTRQADKMRGEPEAVPEDTANRFAERVADRDVKRRAEQRARALRAINDIIPHANGRERKRLRAAANQIRALDDGGDTSEAVVG